jgi:hypothetical protein
MSQNRIELIKTVFFGVAAGLALLGFGIFLWHKVLKWGQNALLPWLRRRMPGLVGLAEKAFEVIDRVATPVKRAVAQAWQKLRNLFLKQDLTISLNQQNNPVNRVEQYLIDQSNGQVNRVTVEEEISWADLPPEAYEQLMMGKRYSVDVTEERDKEVLEYVN